MSRDTRVDDAALCRDIRRRVSILRADAEANEDVYLAMVIANTKRKKRYLALSDVGNAMFLLRLLYGSRRAVAERVSMSTESVREWMICAGPDWTDAAKAQLARGGE